MSNSLVLSSYNGERYVREQLDSVLAQTSPLDQVLISDDGSSDGTPQIVAEYISRLNDPRWSFSANTSNKGWKRNFRDLILQSSCDYVFPCDQDDVWLPSKVQIMSTIMQEYPGIDLLACEVETFCDGGKDTKIPGVVPQDIVQENGIRRITLDPWSLYIRRPGCSYCVRKTFAEEVAHHWNPAWPHDATLWRFAAAKGTLALLDDALIRFRRHSSNASDRKPISNSSRIAEIRYSIEMLDAICRFECGPRMLHPKSVSFIESALPWFEARLEFLTKRSLKGLAAMAANHELYISNRGFLVDIILGLNSKITI